MIEKDTIRLLRECDAGVRMGVDSINDVIGRAAALGMRQKLAECKMEHQKLGTEIRSRLDRFHDRGKKPAEASRRMSQMMTGMKLAIHPGDATIADLMTDGCNMGVKSLNHYLNRYKAADEISKDIAKRLIHLEETLSSDMRGYL